MRKRIYFTVGVITILILGIYCIQRPYKVYKIYSQSNSNFRETDIFVIVYKPWNVEKTVEKIVYEHNKMNGTPKKLTIWLYHSKADLDHGKEFYKAVYEYEEDEMTEVPEAFEN